MRKLGVLCVLCGENRTYTRTLTARFLYLVGKTRYGKRGYWASAKQVRVVDLAWKHGRPRPHAAKMAAFHGAQENAGHSLRHTQLTFRRLYGILRPV